MDEPLQQLEDELKSLRLRSPSPQLVDRLTNELAAETDELTAPVRRYTTASNLGSWTWFGWRAAVLVAVLAVGAAATYVLFKAQPPAAPAPPARLAATDPAAVRPAPDAVRDLYQPVAAANVLYDLKDEGEVQIEGDGSARRVRARYVDTYTWKNPRSNASLKWTVPRDEIRVLPASYTQN
ncbi:MAG: hypothetical protein HYV75_07205 [Opitutae bacterium]|nr:hypothetical protein [Opitutae bacterium]